MHINDAVLHHGVVEHRLNIVRIGEIQVVEHPSQVARARQRAFRDVVLILNECHFGGKFACSQTRRMEMLPIPQPAQGDVVVLLLCIFGTCLVGQFKGTEIRELAPNPPYLFNFYKRVEVKHAGTLTDEQLVTQMNDHEQVLCIVNTRRHASGLFTGLQGEGNYHLSTLMCPAHRRAKLGEIKVRLSKGKPCRVVATTVMEAGIDLDFPVGYRALTGLDSINQAAGRVNREMKRRMSTLFVFEPYSEFARRMPAYVQQSAEVARMILRNHSATPISVAAIESYFEQLYNLHNQRAFDYKQIMEFFSEDGRFNFKRVADVFRIIETPNVTVIVPYDDKALSWVEDLKNTDYPFSVLRKLQPYTVSIFKSEFDRLASKGVIVTICYRTENPFVSCRVAHRFAGKRKLTGTRLPSRWA